MILDVEVNNLVFKLTKNQQRNPRISRILESCKPKGIVFIC